MNRHTRFFALILPMIQFFAACGSRSSSSSGEPFKTVITPQGGEVVMEEEGVNIHVPPGAVNDDIEISITVVQGNVSGNLVTNLYKLEPAGIVFETPVTLTIKVPEEMRSKNIYLAKVVDGRPLGVKGFRYNEVDGTLSAELHSFSIYGGFSLSGDEDCEECTSAYCGEELGDCLNDTHCEAILECYDSCYPEKPQWSCIAECKTNHPEGQIIFDVLHDCVKDECYFCIERDQDIIDIR